jgi:aarF domain-containing kinase
LRRIVVALSQVNKGVYIKLGQHLAQLEYLIPRPYIVAMECMLHEAPQDDFDAVMEVLEDDLGKPVHQLFASIEREPLASASLAQVHVATDFNGRKLAVKVQHQGLRESSEVCCSRCARCSVR